MKYKPTIGLEVHAELKSKTKMFCNSPNNPEEKLPNINVCPVCMGHPGTLPTINKEAVKSVLRMGLAIGGELADYTQFDRKNYFYPDLPKGYQISQYKYPLVSGGELCDVKITRIHLEEDTGRLVHDEDETLIDFNRAGVPLMELVTEPVVGSAKKAKEFAEELRLLLRYLGISGADMEKGQMRVEANISISKTDTPGTKVEVKNLNSFRAVGGAIEYEMERQEKRLEAGKEVVQETRGWDATKQKTYSQRKKEDARDYRYFKEPDLPSLKISEISEFQNLKETLPELPQSKRDRLKKEYGLPEEKINDLVKDQVAAEFFEHVVSETGADSKEFKKDDIVETAINYINTDLNTLMKEKMLGFGDLLMTAENFADLMIMIMEGKISSRVAKDVLREMVETGAEPHVLVKEGGLEQSDDEEFIVGVANKAINENIKAVEDYKAGKENALQFLVGMVMKETKGKSNPEKAREVLQKLLRVAD